jgi:LmbE family N-acetylglucosaminyl deacetylase
LPQHITNPRSIFVGPKFSSEEAIHLTATALALGQLKILAIGSHPDDTVFASGGLILESARMGNEVIPLEITRGQAGSGSVAQRTRENQQAFQALSITTSPLELDFPDGELSQLSRQLYNRLKAEIEAHKPHLVIFTSPEMGWYPHKDHEAVGELFLVGTSQDPSLLELFGIPGIGILSKNQQIRVGEQAQEQKVAAILKYITQLQHLHQSRASTLDEHSTIYIPQTVYETEYAQKIWGEILLMAFAQQNGFYAHGQINLNGT